MAILKLNNKGYTLMELILVVALFSVFFLIAIPNSSIVNIYQENIELKMIQKDLRQARSKAVVDNTSIFAYFYPSMNEYEIKSGEEVIKRKKLKRIKITHFNSDRYTFNNDGRIGGSGTVSILRTNGDLYYLSVGVNTTTINLHKEGNIN